MHVNIVNIYDLRELAAKRLPWVVFDFINGGGNRAAIKRGVSQ